MYGGLGNQLFQLAAAFKAAQLLGLANNTLYIDDRFLGTYDFKRSLEIEFISKYCSFIEIKQSSTPLLSLFSRARLARVLDCRIGQYELIGSVKHLLQLQKEVGNDVLLDGYFQHPDILFDEPDRIAIRDKLFLEHSHQITKIKGSNKVVGIHIRRGDYVSSKVFRTISFDYYRAALENLPKHRKILVFSDDRELSKLFAREIAGIDTRAMNLSLPEEFCLLAACDDYVIANSTFSWWASYLGFSSEKTIVSPSNWYIGNKMKQKNFLLMPYFQLLDY